MTKLTNEQIAALEPGRELGEAVLRHIYGLTGEQIQTHVQSFWLPSICPRAMMGVVDAMRSRGFAFVVIWSSTAGPYVQFMNDRGNAHTEYQGEANLPEAVCVAALKAVAAEDKE